MNPTEVQEEFKKKKKRQIAVLAMVIPVAIGLVLLNQKKDELVMGFTYDQIGIVAVAFIIACLIFSFINWRCPVCKKYLGRSELNPKRCKHCSEVFR